VKPGSIWQMPLHPSPGSVFPSSHCSVDWFTFPSPHAGPEGTSWHVLGGLGPEHGFEASGSEVDPSPTLKPPDEVAEPDEVPLFPSAASSPAAPSRVSVDAPGAEPALAQAARGAPIRAAMAASLAKDGSIDVPPSCRNAALLF
jgi:hypothetical protein